jgi:hypothetical protein
MYKDVEFEVIRMWKVREKIVSVIGALKTIKMGLDRVQLTRRPQSYRRSH